MRKRVRVLIGALIIAMAIAIVCPLLPRHEPVYKGRTLSSWLQMYNETESYQDLVPVDEAIRAIGTNALPQILFDLQRRESAVATALAHLAARHRWIRFPIYGENHYSAPALMALKSLGAEAKPIFPELQKLLENPQTAETAALGFFLIGPAAIPALEGTCRSTNVILRAQAAILIARTKAMPGIAYGFAWHKSALNAKPVLNLGWAYMGNGEQSTLEMIVKELANNDPAIRLANMDALRAIANAPSNSASFGLVSLFTGVNADAVQTAKDTLNQVDHHQ